MLSKVVLGNYVLRIYRFDRKKPRHIVGFVEEVGGKGKKAFTNYDELWEILSSSKSINTTALVFYEQWKWNLLYL